MGGACDSFEDDEEVPALEIGEPEDGFEVTVDRASLDGDILRLSVSHGGGCGDHHYRLYWDGSFLESLPEQVILKVRDETDDFCEGLMANDIAFNVGPLREQHGGDSGEVLLSIENFSGDGPLYQWGGGGREETLEPIVEGEPPRETDEYTIQDARIEDDALVVDFTHAGGCEEHEYTMFWDGLVFETFPPQIDLELFHNANGDTCELAALVTLKFDLSSLPIEGTTVINLSGFEGDLTVE